MIDAYGNVYGLIGGAGNGGGITGTNAQDQSDAKEQAYASQQVQSALGVSGGQYLGQLGQGGGVQQWSGLGPRPSRQGGPPAPPAVYQPPPVTKLQPVTIESRDDQHTVMLDGMPVFRSTDEAEARRTAETLETMSEVMVRKPQESYVTGVDLAKDDSSTVITMRVTGSAVKTAISDADLIEMQAVLTGRINEASKKIVLDGFNKFVSQPSERSAVTMDQQVKAGESRMAKIARKMGLAWPLT